MKPYKLVYLYRNLKLLAFINCGKLKQFYLHCRNVGYAALDYSIILTRNTHQLQWLANKIEVDPLFSDVYHPGLYLKTVELCQQLPRSDTDL